METRLITNHLQRHVDMVLVIVGFHYLAETAFANDFEYFVAVGHVVVNNMNIGILFVIVARIVRGHDWPLFGHSADEVDVRVVEDLLAFVGRQNVAEVLEHLLRLSWFCFGFRHHSITRSVALTASR